MGAADLVEVRVGRPPQKGRAGQVHIVTCVRHTAAEKDRTWWWDPPQDGLWLRIIYADWMTAEGWVKQQKFQGDAWFKPPAASSASAG